MVDNGTPDAFSMIMDAAPTELLAALEFQAKTLGTGRPSEERAWAMISGETFSDCYERRHTNSIVAISLAVV